LFLKRFQQNGHNVAQNKTEWLKRAEAIKRVILKSKLILYMALWGRPFTCRRNLGPLPPYPPAKCPQPSNTVRRVVTSSFNKLKKIGAKVMMKPLKTPGQKVS